MEAKMAEFSIHMDELLESKYSALVTPFMSQYSFWLIISFIVCVVVIIYACKKVQLIPHGFWAGGVEHLICWLRQDVGFNVIGPDADKHMPFLLTFLFFILTANLIGLIPGAQAATGVTGVTGALACFSFVYFIAWGIKENGVLRYFASWAPTGVPFVMRCVLWVIEAFSTCLRLITLAVRLFGNMFAGHLVLGAFAILTSVFFLPVIQDFSAAALVGALPSLLWMVFLILMYCMEMLVACLQAYVFTLLTAVYINLAIEGE